MGVNVPSGGGGRGQRRSVDAELNLIPFIDLLSVCILFLLMTAVWVQISKMSAFSQPSGEALITHSDVSSLNDRKESRDWDVLIRSSGVEVLEKGQVIRKFRPEQSFEQLSVLRSRLSQIDNPKISLRAADDVIYQNVVTVLDTLFALQLTNVTIGGLN